MALRGDDRNNGRKRSDPPVIDHPAAIGPFAEVLAGRNIGVGVGRDGQVLLARPDSAMVSLPRDPDVRKRVADVLARNDLGGTAEELSAGKDDAAGYLRVELPPEDARELRGEPRRSLARVGRLVGEIRDARGRADLNHVVLGAQVMKGNPLGATAGWAGEMAFPGELYYDALAQQHVLLSTAEPAVAPVFRRAQQCTGGRAPRVLILDTGLATTAADELAAGAARAAATDPTPKHPWLQSCHVHTNWTAVDRPGIVDDEDETFDPPLPVPPSPVGAAATAAAAAAKANPPQPSRLLDFEAGHGTFIAGIIEQICPYAEIHAAGVLSSFGDGDADAVLTVLQQMQGTQPYDLVVMSFGTNLLDDEPGIFGEQLMERLGPSLGVAAAGNQATCRPYFPAALPGVVGVGALAADGKAWFSNFGGWVDACAPGVDVVSTFFNDFTESLGGIEGRRYLEWARWSGTSFSAPKVAAVLAQDMYLYGGTAQQAWKRLTSHKHFRYPDLGIVFNV